MLIAGNGQGSVEAVLALLGGVEAVLTLFGDFDADLTLGWSIEELDGVGPMSMVQEEPGAFVFLVLVLLVGFAVMGIGAKRFQTGRLIKNTAPEKVRSVAIGRTELRGKAREAGVVFDQPFTDGTCLYYSYKIEQYVEKTERDDDGNKEKKRTWQTTSSHSLAAPFDLDDGTGEILVLGNAGADFQISDENTFTKTFSGTSIPSSYRKSIDTDVDIADAICETVEWDPHNLATKIESKLPVGSVPGTSNDVKPRASGSPQQPDYSTSSTSGRILKRRISQTVLPVDEDVYVFGAARQRTDPMGSNEQRLVIQGDDDTGRFIVSDKGEDTLAQTYTRWGLGFVVLGLVVSAGAFGFLVDGLV